MKGKNVMALLLCGALSLSALVGCGGTSGQTSEPAEQGAGIVQETAGSQEDDGAAGPQEDGGGASEETYEEHISFTASDHFSIHNLATGIDYTEQPVYQYIMDRFNVDMELWDCAQSEAEDKVRLWITSGTMPDMVDDVNFSIPEYIANVEQGLLKPLPDGWEEKWPALADIVEASGIAEQLKVDGKTYAVPCTLYYNFVEFGEGGLSAHDSLYFRKDWAEQVGMKDLGSDGTITLSELKEYLEKVRDAGLTERLLASSGGDSGLLAMFNRFCKVNPGDFIETDQGFVYNVAEADYTEPVKVAQEWYSEGLIDPDFYLQDDPRDYYETLFCTGNLAAIGYDGISGHVSTLYKGIEEDGGADNGFEAVAMVQPEADDGVVYSQATTNYWRANVFSPGTDDATLERILDILEYFTTVESEIVKMRGVPDVDWKYNDDGSIEQLNMDIITDEETGETRMVDKYQIFYNFGVTSEDCVMSEYNPVMEKEYIDLSMQGYELRSKGTIWPYQSNYEFFTSDSKSSYSVPLTDKKTEIVVNGLDVDSTWAAFVADYQNVWQPLLDDLNAAFFPG